MDTKPFWLVWQPESGPPTVQHETLMAAVNEAERLARAHTGRRFYVLAAERYVVKSDVQHVRLGEDLPF